MSTELIIKCDVNWHAEHIRESYGACIESIIETGRRVANALDTLDWGEKKLLWKKLQFSQQTGSKLAAIAMSSLIHAHVRKLPVRWGTLYELTKLDDDSWAIAEENGLIHPDVERKEITNFIRGRGGQKAMEKKSKRRVTFVTSPKGLERINYKSTIECLNPIIGKDFENLKELREVFTGKDSRCDFTVKVNRAIGFAAGHPAFTVIDNGTVRIDHNPEIETLEKRNEELENKMKLKRIHETDDVELMFYIDHLICAIDAWEQTYGKDLRGITIDKETRSSIRNSCAVLENKTAEFISYVKEIADVP